MKKIKKLNFIIISCLVLLLILTYIFINKNNVHDLLNKYNNIGTFDINENGFKGYINNISENEQEIKLYKNKSCYYKSIFNSEISKIKVNSYNECTEEGKVVSNECYEVEIKDNSATIIKYDYKCSKEAILPDYANIDGKKYKIENIIEIDRVNEEDAIQYIFNGVEKIRLPKYLKAIPKNMYTDNIIKEIRIPDLVKEIGENAFFSSIGGNIENVYLGKNIKEIGKMAFYNNKIKYLKLNDNLKIINNLSFSSNKIEEVVFNNQIEEIYYKAFYNNNIKEINLPSSIKILGVSPIIEIFDDNVKVINLDKFENEISGAPWGAVNAKIEWKKNTN